MIIRHTNTRLIRSSNALPLYDEEEYASLLRACRDVRQGRAVHHAHAGEGRKCRYLGNLLIQMYGKCGALEDARAVLLGLGVHRNVYSWTLAMRAYAQCGHGLQVLELYQQMLHDGIQPDRVTFLCALAACSSLQTLQHMHGCIEAAGFLADAVVRNTLLHMYGECSSLAHAQTLFDADRQHVIFWNSIIGAHTQHGQCAKALVLYQQMLQEGVAPDKVTFINALSACSSLIALTLGKQFHSIIMTCEFEYDIVIGTALIKMYDKCAHVVEARSIFEDMQHRDVVVWNSMLSAYAHHGMRMEAFGVYEAMQEKGIKPNEVTFISVLGACSSLEDLAQGKSIHSHVENHGFESDVIVGTALVHMYGKCEQLEDARKVFMSLDEQNVVSWTAIIEVHATHGREIQALELYKQMLGGLVKPNNVTFVSVLGACTNLMDIAQGKEIHASIIDLGLETDVLVGTALVRMYGEFGEVGIAKKAFDAVRIKNVVCWTTLFTAYAQQGYAKDALLLYQQMLSEGLKADMYLLIHVVEACSSLALLMQSEEIHATIVCSGLESDVAVGTALIDMYGKSGFVSNALNAFERITTHNILSWTALIAVYCHVGHVKKALHLFKQMIKEDVQPDGVIFLSMLSGYSHTGLVDEGLYYFYYMIEQYKVTPTLELFACTIDLIGRAGRLEEAVKFVHHMPVIPGVVIWQTLLGVSKLHDDFECGMSTAHNILDLNPQSVALYVLLSNLCASDVGDEAFQELSNSVVENGAFEMKV